MSYLQRIKVAFAGEKFYPQYTSGWIYFIIILFFDVTIEIKKTRKYAVFYSSSSACNSRFQKSIGRKIIFIQQNKYPQAQRVDQQEEDKNIGIKSYKKEPHTANIYKVKIRGKFVIMIDEITAGIVKMETRKSSIRSQRKTRKI